MKYMIDFNTANVGTHHERYQHLDAFSFDAVSPKDAYRIVSELQSDCEKDVASADLWGEDTSLYDNCYQIDDEGERTPLKELY